MALQQVFLRLHFSDISAQYFIFFFSIKLQCFSPTHCYSFYMFSRWGPAAMMGKYVVCYLRCAAAQTRFT